MSEQAASWDMMDCTKQNGNNMANAKQVLDVHVSKGITVAQSNEHMRNWTEKGWKGQLTLVIMTRHVNT